MLYLPMIVLFLAIILIFSNIHYGRFSLGQSTSLIALGIYLFFVIFFCFSPSHVSYVALNQMNPHPVWIGPAPTNWIPFNEINTSFFLNILMTMPLGIFLGLFNPEATGKTSLKLGLWTGTMIESSQFVFDWLVGLKRWVDINDIITNTLGVILGFLIYKLLTKVMPRVVDAFAV